MQSFQCSSDTAVNSVAYNLRKNWAAVSLAGGDHAVLCFGLSVRRARIRAYIHSSRRLLSFSFSLRHRILELTGDPSHTQATATNGFVVIILAFTIFNFH